MRFKKYYIHYPKYKDGTYHALLFNSNKTFIQEICWSYSFEQCCKDAMLFMDLFYIPSKKNKRVIY